MWADNETCVDLLGFDFLVDELLVVLRDTRLLPITVGVAGDWGSGKSSLLGMTEQALDDEKVLTVSFSPWRFEDYEDVKAALMAAVIGALQERARTDESFASKAGKRLARLVRRVNFLAAARVAGQAALVAHGAQVPPEVAALAEAPLLKPDVEEADGEDQDADRLRSIGDFRADFSELMEALDDSLTMLIVLIDDLDRCLTDTIVDTFEAIRLFLHVPKTAYVIAADQRVVQAAIESRYPAAREGDESLGVDYLEKIIQLSINVPPLSEPEAETYINLLFAELWLEPESFRQLLAAAQKRRRAEQLTVAMNYGIAKDVLGSVPAELEASFALANQIAPVLARGLRGNPRQLKRFLNMLTVRRRAAAARSIELDAAVLAKLMILEPTASEGLRTALPLADRPAGSPTRAQTGRDAYEQRQEAEGDGRRERQLGAARACRGVADARAAASRRRPRPLLLLLPRPPLAGGTGHAAALCAARAARAAQPLRCGYAPYCGRRGGRARRERTGAAL
jgi:hypothetical protein